MARVMLPNQPDVSTTSYASSDTWSSYTHPSYTCSNTHTLPARASAQTLPTPSTPATRSATAFATRSLQYLHTRLQCRASHSRCIAP
eukprot:2915776-Rhodomonas_salina.3